MNILRLYKETEKKEDREWFLISSISLFSLLCAIFLTVIFVQGSNEYYKANGTLFILDIMVFLIIIGGQQKIKNIYLDLKLKYYERDSLTLTNYADIIMLLVFATAMLSFIFILDLSFIKNTGIRVSAVVSVAIVKLLKDLFWTKK